jgi:hypothetical protein
MRPTEATELILSSTARIAGLHSSPYYPPEILSVRLRVGEKGGNARNPNDIDRSLHPFRKKRCRGKAQVAAIGGTINADPPRIELGGCGHEIEGSRDICQRLLSLYSIVRPPIGLPVAIRTPNVWQKHGKTPLDEKLHERHESRTHLRLGTAVEEHDHRMTSRSLRRVERHWDGQSVRGRIVEDLRFKEIVGVKPADLTLGIARGPGCFEYHRVTTSSSVCPTQGWANRGGPRDAHWRRR